MTDSFSRFFWRAALPATALLFLIAVSSTTPAPSTITVSGRISEAGKPVAARLYIESETGEFYHAEMRDPGLPKAVPYRVDRGQSKEIHTAVSAGEFVATLPAGDYTFTVERGKEYLPLTKSVTVSAGMAQPVELPIKRWTDMAKKGWYSGDTHVHRSVAETRVPLLAEDLNIAFPLTYWVTEAHESPVEAAKSVKQPPGNEPIEIAPDHLIYPLNTEYELFTYGGKRHTLGAVFVIGHKQPLELGAPLVKPIAEEARKQGALLDLDKHTWPWTPMIVPVMQVDLFELANNHIWRTEFLFRDWTIETLPEDWEIETDNDGNWTEHGWIDFGFKTYYAFLNCGFDMQPTGGTAVGVHPVPMGFGRVYVNLSGEFTYENWLAGLKAGNSFVTTGPMLKVQFNEQPAGTNFQQSSAEPAKCEIAGTVESFSPVDRVEIIVNGEVVKTIKPQAQKTAAGAYRFSIRDSVPIDGSAWVAVRCFQPRDEGRYFYAHTAPVHFRNSNSPLRPRLREVRYLLKRVNDELSRNRDLLTPDELSEFKQAQALYEKLLDQAQ